MEKFDKYDEVDYTGKSDPDVWETHVEFYLSKQTALARYAEIKRLHPEAAKQHALRPFFRKTGEINLHRDMIKDLGSAIPLAPKACGSSNTGCLQLPDRLPILRAEWPPKIRRAGASIVAAKNESGTNPPTSVPKRT